MHRSTLHCVWGRGIRARTTGATIVGVNSRDLMLLDTCRRHNRTISDTSVVYKGRGRPSRKHIIGAWGSVAEGYKQPGFGSLVQHLPMAS